MDLDKDDLAALCAGMTTDEVDRVHRLLHEWNVGPDNSFPVQLALLTKAQWRIAANLPRLMNDSRKLIELHLAEYRQQTKLLVDDFNQMVQTRSRGFEASLSAYTERIEKAANQIQSQLDDAKFVAKYVKSIMDGAASQWKDIKASTMAQCERLEQVANDLNDRSAWQTLLTALFWFLLTIILGILLGHYCWTK